MAYLKCKNKLPPPSRKSYFRHTTQPQPSLNIPDSAQQNQPSLQVPHSTSLQEIEQGEIVSAQQNQPSPQVPQSISFQEIEKGEIVSTLQLQQPPPIIQHNNVADNVMPGLIVVIPNPTSKILAELFQKNINYTLIPEYILAQPQMLMQPYPPQP